ncbi:unnamed protein product [Fraxinus pennsylvanica]|uniref:tRNA synthetases class I (E and Q) anti-codon binding domain-containing protein n=1 Tax=Fraxinus pennsylvanica TaxID=56036 RepID=A0AAD1Z106_9LAMI|nr:unnamed protein product [Fraxinus pennsylvanica]
MINLNGHSRFWNFLHLLCSDLQGVLHWVVESALGIDPLKIEVRLFDKLFIFENPAELDDWLADLNPESKLVISEAFNRRGATMTNLDSTRVPSPTRLEVLEIYFSCSASKFFLDSIIIGIQEEAAEAYDIVAIKFRGLNAVTNFEISRFDVKSIRESSTLPIGG